MPLHKMHIYRQYLKLISENYAICIAMISELRYAVYEVLDGTNCKDVGKVKSPAEPIVSDLWKEFDGNVEGDAINAPSV